MDYPLFHYLIQFKTRSYDLNIDSLCVCDEAEFNDLSEWINNAIYPVFIPLLTTYDLSYTEPNQITDCIRTTMITEEQYEFFKEHVCETDNWGLHVFGIFPFGWLSTKQKEG